MNKKQIIAEALRLQFENDMQERAKESDKALMEEWRDIYNNNRVITDMFLLPDSFLAMASLKIVRYFDMKSTEDFRFTTSAGVLIEIKSVDDEYHISAEYKLFKSSARLLKKYQADWLISKAGEFITRVNLVAVAIDDLAESCEALNNSADNPAW